MRAGRDIDLDQANALLGKSANLVYREHKQRSDHLVAFGLDLEQLMRSAQASWDHASGAPAAAPALAPAGDVSPGTTPAAASEGRQGGQASCMGCGQCHSPHAVKSLPVPKRVQRSRRRRVHGAAGSTPACCGGLTGLVPAAQGKQYNASAVVLYSYGAIVLVNLHDAAHRASFKDVDLDLLNKRVFAVLAAECAPATDSRDSYSYVDGRTGHGSSSASSSTCTVEPYESEMRPVMRLSYALHRMAPKPVAPNCRLCSTC